MGNAGASEGQLGTAAVSLFVPPLGRAPPEPSRGLKLTVKGWGRGGTGAWLHVQLRSGLCLGLGSPSWCLSRTHGVLSSVFLGVTQGHGEQSPGETLPSSPHSSRPGHPRLCRPWPSAWASSMGSEVENEGVRGQRLGVSGHSAQALVSSIRALVPSLGWGPITSQSSRHMDHHTGDKASTCGFRGDTNPCPRAPSFLEKSHLASLIGLIHSLF